MKTLLLTLSVLFSSQAFALTPQVLSKQDTKVIVDYLNNVCGDTFCDGDFWYDIKSMTCEPGYAGDLCELKFTMTGSNYVTTKSKNVEASYTRTYLGKCTFEEIKSRDEAFEKDGSVKEQLYDSILDCMGALELELDKK